VAILAAHGDHTRENAAKIHAGMTLEDVEGILGGQSRADVTSAARLQIDLDPDPIKNEMLADALEEKAFKALGANPLLHPLEWRSDEVVLLALFDDGKVIACAAFPVRPTSESLLDKLRRWLRL
jgi:hypothetical protein